MRNTANTILGIVLLWAVFFVPDYVSASQQLKETQNAEAIPKPEMAVPELSEIIPLSANLSGHFARLENDLEQSEDFSAIETEYAAIAADLQVVFSGVRQEYLLGKAPPLLSLEYLSQFRSEIWSPSPDEMRLFSWPGVHFFREHGWNFLFQLCFVLVVFSVIHRNKTALKASKHWAFLADRPVASALFITIATLALFIAYSPYADDLKLAYTIVGGIACVRLLGRVVDRPWKKQAAYCVMILHIVSALLVAVGLPLHLLRLYIFLMSMIVLCLIVRWIKKCSTLNEVGIYAWLLRAAGVLFVVIIIAEL